MKTMLGLVLMLMLMCASSAIAGQKLSKAEEKVILMSVVHEYELNEDEARLLFAIRQHENGAVGLEFGVGQDVPNHPAKRFKGQPKRSLKVQAQWAAGTIKKRFDGSLKGFAVVWCPKGPTVWFKSVNRILMTDYAVAPMG